jgi:hypothetical protein
MIYVASKTIAIDRYAAYLASMPLPRNSIPHPFLHLHAQHVHQIIASFGSGLSTDAVPLLALALHVASLWLKRMRMILMILMMMQMRRRMRRLGRGFQRRVHPDDSYMYERDCMMMLPHALVFFVALV